MSTTVVTVPVTVTASQSVVVVTSTIATTNAPYITGLPTSSSDPESSASAATDGANSSSGAGATSSSSPSSASSGSATPVGAIAGGVVGGVALIAFIIVLACFMRKRSKAKKTPSPFPDDDDEKGPSVIAGLPPNPSTTHLRPLSGSYNPSMAMTEASAMPLLGTDGSVHSSSHGPGGAFMADARSAHMQRPSTTSLAPSFIMGSSASYPHSHSSHPSQPWSGAVPPSGYDSPSAFAAGYPDVHRTAFYEPHLPPGVDPRALPASTIAAGSAAVAYHNAGASASTASPLAHGMDARALAAAPGMASLPMGAAPANYAAVSEAARLRSASQSGSHGPHGAELRSGAASMSDASSRRGSHGSTLAMHPAVAQLSEASPQFHADGGSPHRRPPAAGFPGYQSNLNTIPGSVAASEIASADHQSLYSGAQSHGGDATVPPRLPSIPASSPLILQDAAAVANAPRAASFGSTAARLTAEPATDTLRSNDASTGTYNSDGTYNTYTGAIKGQLRVVGSSDAHADGARGTTTIVEEESPVSGPRREMSSDSKAGEFWIEGREKSKLGAAGQRLGQHSSNNSTSSINKSGSRMIEMLDVDEQPHVPESVTGRAEPSPSTPSRPSFWKERTKSSQSIAKVFRSSPLLHANASPSERSPAPTSGARLSGVAAESSRSHSVPEHLPPLDLGRSVAISDHRASDSPKTEGDAEMWKDASKQKHGGAMRRWTRKKAGRSGSGTQGVDNEMDVDELFR